MVGSIVPQVPLLPTRLEAAFTTLAAALPLPEESETSVPPSVPT